MKRTIGLVACILMFCLCTTWNATADQQADRVDGHRTIMPDMLQWVTTPALPPGAKIAVLTGNPTKAGDQFAIRIQIPDGYKFPPHWHPTDENVTVLRGTMLFGAGEKFDSAALKEAPVGSFTRMPKEMKHFAMAKGATVIQLHGEGPFEIHYVNPSDDPRKK
jgi:hypothetical protein